MIPILGNIWAEEKNSPAHIIQSVFVKAFIQTFFLCPRAKELRSSSSWFTRKSAVLPEIHLSSLVEIDLACLLLKCNQDIDIERALIASICGQTKKSEFGTVRVSQVWW